MSSHHTLQAWCTNNQMGLMRLATSSGISSDVRTAVDSDRIGYRDTLSYFGILLDDNNRKPVCRLHFNRTQKYLGVLDAEKKETRHPIDKLDDIYNFSEVLIQAAKLVA